MKIAIFHNLKNGGGLHHISCIIKELSRHKIIVDVYTHQKIFIPHTNKTYCYPLSQTNNIFNHVKLVINETEIVENQIAKIIIKQSYDYVFVFPCCLQQSPNILKYLPIENTIYFFLESIREFYEKTSFNYFSIKQVLSRLVRYPIKFQDFQNCQKAGIIITNSYYSKHILKKIYNKDSYVIYPGFKKLQPIKIFLLNNKKSYSFGILTMLKGHHISSLIDRYTYIFGMSSHEKILKYLDKKTKLHNININEHNKSSIFNRFTFFLANQINKPFGLTTLEAITSNQYIIGRNEAGTSEIVNNGLNASVYNVDNIYIAKRIFANLKNKRIINYYKASTTNWKETVDKMLYIMKYV